MSWGVFPDGRMGLSSLLDRLLEPSLPDPLECSLLDPILGSSSPDPLWSLLYSTLWRSRLHLTLSGVLFARPSTGFFIWPSLESPLLDPLLESSSLSQSESELLPSLGQLSLCSGCVLFCLSSVLSGSLLFTETSIVTYNLYWCKAIDS
jgi:hypothetical protein